MTGHTETHQPTYVEVENARIAAISPAITKSFVSSVLSILVFSVLLLPQSAMGLGLWLCIRVAVSAGCLLALKRLAMSVQSPDSTIRALAMVMAASGTVWGLVPLLIRPDEPEWRAVVVLWLFGNQSVVTAACSPARPVFWAACGSVTVVGAVSVALYGDSFGLVLAGLLFLGGVYSVLIFGAMHQSANVAISGRLTADALATSLTEQQAELKAANVALSYLANRDELTGLLNRRSFKSLLADEKGRLRAGGWLVYLDIDHFKSVNDSMGHAAGDRILQIAADRWSSVLPAAAVLARTGGDEFAGWLSGASESEARHIALRLNQCLATPVALATSSPARVTCSIGLTRVLTGERFAAGAARADRALYAAKNNGRNTAEMSDEEVPDPTQSQSNTMT